MLVTLIFYTNFVNDRVFFLFSIFCNETVHVLHLLLLLLPQIPKEKIANLKLTGDKRNFTIMYIKEMSPVQKIHQLRNFF